MTFDTETTDRYNFKLGPLDPSQPRIVSLAALLMSDDGQNEVATYYAIVRPDTFVIDNKSKAARVNGITHEFALANGVDGLGVINSFLRLFKECRFAVAFNKDFDNAMITSEIVRRCPDNQHLFDRNRTRCAMMASSWCMKLPNQYGYPGFAWPKLEDAYFWMFQQKMTEAHHALGDVRSTAYLTAALQSLNYWDVAADKILV